MPPFFQHAFWRQTAQEALLPPQTFSPARHDVRLTEVQLGSQHIRNPGATALANPPGGRSMGNYGTLILAIPTMNAAMAAIEEKQDFTVTSENKEVFRMSWKERGKARTALRDCRLRR